jgi:LPS sulfotransferase NodH
VLEHVGAGRAEIREPPLRRQGDDRSTRWVERFGGERAAV